MTFFPPCNKTKNHTKNSRIRRLRKPWTAVQYLIRSLWLWDVLFYSRISAGKLSHGKRYDKYNRQGHTKCWHQTGPIGSRGEISSILLCSRHLSCLAFQQCASIQLHCLSGQVNASVSEGCLPESIHLLRLQSSEFIKRRLLLAVPLALLPPIIFLPAQSLASFPYPPHTRHIRA